MGAACSHDSSTAFSALTLKYLNSSNSLAVVEAKNNISTDMVEMSLYYHSPPKELKKETVEFYRYIISYLKSCSENINVIKRQQQKLKEEIDNEELKMCNLLTSKIQNDINDVIEITKKEESIKPKQKTYNELTNFLLSDKVQLILDLNEVFNL